MKITPSWVGTFETNLQTLIQDAWQRMSSKLVWDKFMDVKQSQTLNELFFYLIETARIQTEDQGGQKRFDDIAATFFSIQNQNSGAGLRLTKNEIEDNMMASPGLRGMPALDYAANWSKQMGGNAAYWPQQLLFQLILAGESTKGYDAINFFANNHPINLLNAATGTFANLFTGAAASTPATDPLDAIYPGAQPIDASVSLDQAITNIVKVFTYIQSLKQANGAPRQLRLKYLLHGPDLQRRAHEIFDTKFFGTGGGATENVVSRMGIEPVQAAELITAGEYYLACEMLPGEGGPIIFQDRAPYALTSYQPESQAELQRRKEFEWMFDGRNAGAYGHPYLLFKVKPT